MHQEHTSKALSRKVLGILIVTTALSGCAGFDGLLSAQSQQPSQSLRNILKADKSTGATGGVYDPDGPLAEINDPNVFYRTAAQVAMGEHDYENAVRNYAKLASAEPENMENVLNLAHSLRLVGRNEDGERLLRQALRENPQSFDLTEELGKSLLASGQLREGVALIEQLADHPKVPPQRAAVLRSAMGVAFDRAGDHKGAQAQYEIALVLDPLSTSTLNNAGLSFAMEGNLGKAEKALRRALVTPSAGVQVRQNLAMVLALQGRQKEAQRLALQDLPENLANDVIGYYAALSGKDEGLWQNASASAGVGSSLPQRVR